MGGARWWLVQTAWGTAVSWVSCRGGVGSGTLGKTLWSLVLTAVHVEGTMPDSYWLNPPSLVQDGFVLVRVFVKGQPGWLQLGGIFERCCLPCVGLGWCAVALLLRLRLESVLCWHRTRLWVLSGRGPGLPLWAPAVGFCKRDGSGQAIAILLGRAERCSRSV